MSVYKPYSADKFRAFAGEFRVIERHFGLKCCRWFGGNATSFLFTYAQ
jgi:hypothetical protein